MSAARRQTIFFYGALFAALGAHLPFWPLWLADWGLSPGEVGLYITLGFATKVIAGIAFPMLADRLDARRVVLSALAAFAALVFALHLFIDARWLLLAATLTTGAALAGVMPLGEALGAGAAKAHGFAYAPARAWGSVAFLATNLIVGALLARFGADVVLIWVVVGFLLTAHIARRHPGGGTLRGQRPPGFAEMRRLMTEPTFALFTLGASLLLSSHAVYYAYGSIHWRALGLSEDVIGALWAFSVAVEIGVMFWIAPRVRIGPVAALALSGLGGVVRWTSMMFDPGLFWLWPLQALHALTFAAGHLGAIAFIQAAVPERYGATAQGAFMGLGGGTLTALAMGASAALYPLVGGQVYGLAALMSFAGLWAALVLRQRWTGEELAIPSLER